MDFKWREINLFHYKYICVSKMSKRNRVNFDFMLTLRMLHNICVPVWLSGRALRQQRKRLWVRFPGNTNTDKNV